MMKKGILGAALVAVLLAGCGGGVQIEPLGEQAFGNQTAVVDEIRFRSGGFRLVGELRSPLEGGPHPVIVMVHGSGGATRDGAVNFLPLIELFLRNGYAVLSWDKPGSGESTGEFDGEHTIIQLGGPQHGRVISRPQPQQRMRRQAPAQVGDQLGFHLHYSAARHITRQMPRMVPICSSTSLAWG